MFHRASERSQSEVEGRKNALEAIGRFGIDYLDDALVGIFKHDLIVLGAPSGAGKTELCCRIALANMADGRNVHYIALEAEPDEIERRLKFQIFAQHYFADRNTSKPRPTKRITYKNWRLGAFVDELKEYEDRATDFMERAYKSLFLKYKTDSFGLPEMIESVTYAARETSLIIIDHVHYFDFDSDNENKAIKEIAMQARNLAINVGKPLLLVAHLRKRDRQNQDLVAGLDEFHGSSDLTKIATRVISIAPGSPTSSGKYETYIRIAKDRLEGGVNRYVGRILFDPSKNDYLPEYKVGLATCTRATGFEELDHSLYPHWAKRSGNGSGFNY